VIHVEASGFGQGDGGEGFAGDGGAGGYDGDALSELSGVYGGDEYGGGYDAGYGGDPGYGAPAADPAATMQALQGVIGQAVQQSVAPLNAQLAQMQMEAGATQLVSQHPELGEPENAQRLIDTARQVARQIGSPELAERPQFWGLVHAAMRSAEAQAAEHGRQSVDAGDEIVNAGQAGRRALPFS
jgi:hypothetical protein